MVSIDDVKTAQKKIKSYINDHNFLYADKLSELYHTKIYLKLENLQPTGSFKIRGAINALLSLTKAQREKGVVAASAGNHAQGVALACKLTNTKCTIVMPANAPKGKISATRNLGAEVIFNGSSFDDALTKALEIQKTTQATMVHAFDDARVIAGQGTIGLEIIEDLPDVDNVIVPVGGGGLISGISTAIKSINKNVKLYGVEAETVNSLSEALNKQHTVLVPANGTMADGINVRKIGELPFEIIKKNVDKVFTVSEEEIAMGIFQLAELQKVITEGAGAVGVAALFAKKINLTPSSKTVIVVSGGNIDMNKFINVVEHSLIASKKRIHLDMVIKDEPGALQRALNCINANIESIEQSRELLHLKYNTQLVSIVFDVAGEEQYQEILKNLTQENIPIINN